MESLDRLSGWKEIAGYLKKSVRSVQRWERELGLPVQRIKGRLGQTIYASRSELDDWLRRTQLPTELDAEGLPEDSRLPVDRPRRSVVIAAGVSAGLVVCVLLAAFMAQAGEAVATRVEIRNGQVEGLAKDGHQVWSHRFAFPVLPIPEAARAGTPETADVDLDGDGAGDFVVPIRFGERSFEPEHTDTVAAFSVGGRLMWTASPLTTLTCGGQTFEGPWQIGNVVVSADLPRRVWVSYFHHTWWPSFVVEVSQLGDSAVVYVQAGWIMSMANWRYQGRNVLAVGGVMNEHARASLVVLNTEAGPVVFPAKSDAFNCGMTPASPLKAWLFPRLEVSEAQKMLYGFANALRVVDGGIRVGLAGMAEVVVDHQGQVADFSFTDLHWSTHRHLSAAGVIAHWPGVCTEPRAPKEIREWMSPDTWRSTTFVPAQATSQDAGSHGAPSR